MIRRCTLRLASAAASLGLLGLLQVTTAHAQVVETPKVEIKAPVDAPLSVEDATREAQREARDAARDRVQDARDTARDANEAARDTVRDTRETVRDANEAVRDAARETRDTVRDVRRTLRGERGPIRPENMRSADIGIWFGRANNEGLLVTDVNTRGAIANLNLHEGDRIVSINGNRVAREVDFMRYAFVNNARNEKVKVIVLRDGKEEEVWFEPQVFVQEVSSVRSDPVEDLGIILDDRVSDRLLVWRVVPRSPAFFGGVRAGDEIVKFAGESVVKPSELVSIVEKTNSGTATLAVMRNNKEREIDLDLTAATGNDDRRTTFRQNLDENNRQPEVRTAPPPRRATTYPNAPRRGIFTRRGR